jgi:hypothetical protein
MDGGASICRTPWISWAIVFPTVAVFWLRPCFNVVSVLVPVSGEHSSLFQVGKGDGTGVEDASCDRRQFTVSSVGLVERRKLVITLPVATLGLLVELVNRVDLLL